jgi:hypothetical protein
VCDNEDGDLDVVDNDGIPVGKGITELDECIEYSGYIFTHAQIDLRHINYGTLAGGKYKKEKARTRYDKNDVLAFLKLLHGISKDVPDAILNDELGEHYRYKEKVDSPISKNKGIEHILVFDVYENFNDVLISITLFIEN